jgi:hypothetical protein
MLDSKQLHFRLIYYTRLITDILLVIRKIIISSQFYNRNDYVNYTKEDPKIL